MDVGQEINGGTPHYDEHDDEPQHVRLVKFLEDLGLEVRRKRAEVEVKECPFCHEGINDPSNQWKLYINANKGAYWCHRCKASGHISQFKRRLEGYNQDVDIKIDNRLDYCERLWHQARPLSDKTAEPAQRYINGRGLKFDPTLTPNLRLHPACRYKTDDNQNLDFPALICRVDDVHGQLTGLHRIYLTLDGKKAPVSQPKKSLGPISGGSVRIGGFDSKVLHVTEGIETALAIRQVLGVPVLAAVSAGGMEKLEFSDEASEVHIWADLDASGRGKQAANTLANRITGTGRTVFVHLPGGPLAPGVKSKDWLDVLNAESSLIEQSMKTTPPLLAKAKIEVAVPSAHVPTIIYEKVDWPNPLGPEAFHGLAGEIVRAIEPHTESDPAGLLAQLLVAVGNAVGRTAYYQVEATRHFPNLFTVNVGATGKGRKGTSLDQILEVMRRADPVWTSDNIKSGLSTGEGIIHAVRDRQEREKAVKDKNTGEVRYEMELADEGVEDKRLLVIETEFSSPLRVASRDNNTLSGIIRQAWDRGDLRTLTKTNPQTATNVHISIIGHITAHELRRYLTETEALNGFGNRFLWVCVKRSKALPLGGEIHLVNFAPMIQRMEAAISKAKDKGMYRIRLSSSAEEIWRASYPILSSGKPGQFGAMIGRAEAQVIRLASVYCVLDASDVIQPVHLHAALTFWDYCEESCRYIFGSYLGDHIADRILEELRESKDRGLTRNEIREIFQRKVLSARIEQALELLTQFDLAFWREETTGGRPSQRWFAKRRKV